MQRRGWLSGVIAICLGCSAGSTPEPVAASDIGGASASVERLALTPEADPQIAPRSGSLAARVRPGLLKAPLVAYYRGAGYEVVGLSLPLKQSEARGVHRVRLDSGGLAVATTGALFASAEGDSGLDVPAGPTLWAMIPAGQARSLRGTLVRLATDQPGELIRFEAQGEPPPARRDAVEHWANAVQSRYATTLTPYHSYLSQRVGKAFARRKPEPASGVTDQAEFLARLLLHTGPEVERQRFVHEHRPLWRKRVWSGRKLSTLKAPERFSVPYRQLSQVHQLSPVNESLASWVPPEFYYVRARSPALLRSVFRRLGTLSLPGVVSGDLAQDRAIWERTLRELGFTDGFVESLDARVAGLALIGSDTHWAMGSDVTLIFEVDDPASFVAALDTSLESFSVDKRSWTLHSGSRIDVALLSNGSRQHRLVGPGRVVVSNSLNAIRRVAQSKATRRSLLTEADFQYLVSRDREQDGDVLLFAGERFVQNNLSPERVLLQARRQLAQAELRLPLFAELLYGQLFGRLPTTTRALAGTQLLSAGELRHVSGEDIRFKPGEVPNSVWGTAARMTSLIDLKPISTITQQEASAYEVFSKRVELGGASATGAVAVRIGVAGHPRAPREFTLRVRSLPLDPEYAGYLALVDDGRVYPPADPQGLRLRIALGQSADWKLGVGEWIQRQFGLRVNLEEVGSWLEVGVEDRYSLLKSAAELFGLPQHPGDSADARSPHGILGAEQLERRAAKTAKAKPSSAAGTGHQPAGLTTSSLASLKDIPAFVQIGVQDGQHAKHLLEGWLQTANSNGGSVRTERLGQYRGVDVAKTQVHLGECGDCDLLIYSAIARDRLVAALNRQTLFHVLDAALEARSSGAGEPTQIVARSGAELGSPLSELVRWGFEATLRERQLPARELVESLYSGDETLERQAPYAERARYWFGFAPVTPDGELYEWVEDGISDPRRGTLASPAWGANAPAGSALRAWTQLLGNALLGVTFESEAELDGVPLRSLRIDGSVHLAK
jgi:hypothetical protein